jgi:hypothetical protein
VSKQYNIHLKIEVGQNDDDDIKFTKKLFKKLEKNSTYFELMKDNNNEVVKIKLN